MSAGTAIAIDLGGTQLRVALVEGNRLLDRAALPTDTAAGPAGILLQINQLVEQVSGRARANIAGIGMSCAGPINTDTGTVTDIPTLPGWNGFPLAEELSRCTNLAVRVENDGIAAALGAGLYKDLAAVKEIVSSHSEFTFFKPSMEEPARQKALARWHDRLAPRANCCLMYWSTRTSS